MNSSKNKILDEWKIRISKAQVGHYKSCELYLKKHSYIGFSLVIISSILTGCLFLKPSNEIVQWGMAAASIISSSLATLQIFMRPAEKAEVHRQCAAKYGNLRRKIESTILEESHDENEKSEVLLMNIKTEWDSIAEYAPLTTLKVRNQVREILNKDSMDN